MAKAAATAAVLFFFGLTFLQAQVGKRKALIIGNSNYSDISFPELHGTPIKDADAMSQMLEIVGFDKEDISIAYNLTEKQFVDTLLTFRDHLGPEDSALFYFSGHGFSIDSADFLVPIDFSVKDTKKAAREESVALTQIISFLMQAKSRVIILDACRTDFPLLKNMTGNPSRVSLDGLAAVQGSGSLIAYATSAGKASSAHSPSGLSIFTQYLVNSLAARPSSMLDALSTAKSLTIANSTQVPAVYDEMQGSFLLAGASLTSPRLSHPQSFDPGQASSDLLEWSDIRTHHMWTRSDNQISMNWKGAYDYCTSLRSGGFTDWRPPQVKELEELKTSESKHGYHISEEIHLSDRYIWSNSVVERGGATDLNVVYDFRKSDVTLRDSARVLCIRDDYQIVLTRVLELAGRDNIASLASFNQYGTTQKLTSLRAMISLPKADICLVESDNPGERVEGEKFGDAGIRLVRVSKGYKYVCVYSDFAFATGGPGVKYGLRELGIQSLSSVLLSTAGMQRYGHVNNGDAFKTSQGIIITLAADPHNPMIDQLLTVYPQFASPIDLTGQPEGSNSE